MSYSGHHVILGTALWMICAFTASTLAAAPPYRISAMGTDGDAGAEAMLAAAALNPVDDEVFVVWCGDDQTPPLADDEMEIWGQRLNASTGAPVGPAIRISFMGTDGDSSRSGCYPDIAYNTTDHEYLVVWDGDGAVDGRFEIHGRRIDASSGSLLASQLVIGNTGPPGDALYDSYDAAVTHNPGTDEYLVVWSGDDNTSPQLDNEFEIFAQRLNGTDASAIGGRTKISHQGPDSGLSQKDYDAVLPDVVLNPGESELLVVWQGVSHADLCIFPCTGQYYVWWEIYAQRLDAVTGAELGDDYRISDMSSLGTGGVIVRYCSGSPCYVAREPAVVFNPDVNQYLVVWRGDEDGSSSGFELEVHGQRLSGSDGSEIGANDFKISDVGPAGNSSYDAYRPAVGYLPTEGSYLVGWDCDDGGALANDELEIWGRWLAGTDASSLGSPVRLTAMGPDGDSSYDALDPELVSLPAGRRFLAIWEGNDDNPPLGAAEMEIWGAFVHAPIFSDGFETGDTSAWSASTP